MKALKRILFVLGTLLAVLIVVGFIMPSEIRVERSRVIDAPVEMIYDQVNNLRQWEKWSPWHKIDPAMEITYANGGIGENSSYSWTSNHKSVGNGKLTIEDAKPFEFINTVMDFGENGSGKATFKFVQHEDGVIVTWDMHSDVGKNPFMRLMGILIKRSINDAYDRGLEDIDAECQHLKNTEWYYIKVKKIAGWKYYGISNEKTTLATMQPLMEEYYGKLYGKLINADVKPSGSAFSVYHSWGDEFHMECGVPVDNNEMAIKGLESKEIKSNTYAVLRLNGSYDKLSGAHGYFMEWIKENEIELSGPVIEKYKVGPDATQNAEEWLTYILYPIK